MKYAWITQHRDSFPVAVMCDVLNVSTSGYYDSIDRPPSARAERHERIQQAVPQVHAESHGIYGSYKIAEVLQQREDLESACRNTVAAAMRELGLKSRVCKRFTPTTTQTDPTKQPADNTLDRDFTADGAESQMGDRHHLPGHGGRLGLPGGGGRFVQPQGGGLVDRHSLATELVSDALRRAIERVGRTASELLHHRIAAASTRATLISKR